MYVEDNDENHRAPLNPNYPHLLLVEGKEGGWLYEMACRFAGVEGKIEIRSVGENSGTAFGRTVRVLKAVGLHLQTIAIIRDAEENPAGAWQSACDCLERAGLPRPIQSGKLTTQSSGIQCAALIVPDANTPGSMETVCWASLDGQEIKPLITCVEDFLLCAWDGDQAIKPSTKALMDKARIRALLAVGASTPRLVKPDKRFIEVLKENKFWDWGHPAFAPIIDFVKTVARVP